MKTKLYIILASIAIYSCQSNHNSGNSNHVTHPEVTIGKDKVSKLVISNVEITPALVKVGTPSPFNAYATNQGNIVSNDFDVNVYARHEGNTNEIIGCCQPTHVRGIEPGETLLIYSGNVGVNDPGSYELVVILKLADGTEINKFWKFGGTAN